MYSNKKIFVAGSIDVICGPMFSGKTEEILRRLNQFKYAKLEFLTYKHKIDNRNADTFASRNGRTIKTKVVSSAIQMYKDIKKYPNIKVIVIDEVQFFDAQIVEVIDSLANEGYQIIVDGLDKDFRGEPFPIMAKLCCLADNIYKLSAICLKCGNYACFSQRLINNQPADYNSPIILIGDSESYEARCRNCFECPNKPKIKVEE